MSLLSLVTVDDEAHIHDGLDAIIDWKSLGYVHSGSALNGNEALALISSLRPDVILTDIKMPGIDGLELIESIRSWPDYAPVIIVISGYDEFDYVRTALRHSVYDYLLKPIDENELGVILSRTRAERLSPRDATRRARAPAPSPEPVAADEIHAHTAVRRLLSGERADEIIRTAGSHLLNCARCSLHIALFLPVDSHYENLRQPLSSMELRQALAASKARESSDWLVSESFGGASTIF
ncbi:MAG: response regulator, partial [Spirochaetota bacterium]